MPNQQAQNLITMQSVATLPLEGKEKYKGKTSSFTIVENKNLRGILAPVKLLSKRLLEDIIDFIELSQLKIIKESESLIKEADQKKSWLSLKEMKQMAKKTK